MIMALPPLHTWGSLGSEWLRAPTASEYHQAGIWGTRNRNMTIHCRVRQNLPVWKYFSIFGRGGPQVFQNHTDYCYCSKCLQSSIVRPCRWRHCMPRSGHRETKLKLGQKLPPCWLVPEGASQAARVNFHQSYCECCVKQYQLIR